MIRLFWDKVAKSDGCWEWKGSRQPIGYGKCYVAGKTMQAHRVAWELAVGPIPDGLKVLHRCDNRACVRPSHLFLGTQQDNVDDCISKGRFPSRAGTKNGRAKLTPTLVEDIRLELRAGNKTQMELAAQFGIDQTTISKIKLNRIWIT